VTLLFRELHWLKMRQWTEYKLAVLVYRCLNSLALSYLANYLESVADFDSQHRLRLSSTSTLVVPSTRLFTVGDHAVPVAHVWNTLPTEVTSSASIPTFKRQLDIIVRMELPQQLRMSLTLFSVVLLDFCFCFFVRCPSSHFDIVPP